MIKIFKNLEKKDLLIVLVVAALVVFSVFLDLRMPEYMSEITKLVQTEGSKMNDILIAGVYMIICALGSLVCRLFYFTFISKILKNYKKKSI